MVELRAEDVERALDVLTVDGVFLREMTRHNAHDFAAAVADLVAVAREWLASQEQTPDIAISRDENGEWPEWAALLVTAVTPTFNSHLLNENIGFAFLDALAEHDKSNPAALVGFHPQPEGDKGDER